jgi:hypothetical protein
LPDPLDKRKSLLRRNSLGFAHKDSKEKRGSLSQQQSDSVITDKEKNYTKETDQTSHIDKEIKERRGSLGFLLSRQQSDSIITDKEKNYTKETDQTSHIDKESKERRGSLGFLLSRQQSDSIITDKEKNYSRETDQTSHIDTEGYEQKEIVNGSGEFKKSTASLIMSLNKTVLNSNPIPVSRLKSDKKKKYNLTEESMPKKMEIDTQPGSHSDNIDEGSYYDDMIHGDNSNNYKTNDDISNDDINNDEVKKNIANEYRKKSIKNCFDDFINGENSNNDKSNDDINNDEVNKNIANEYRKNSTKKSLQKDNELSDNDKDHRIRFLEKEIENMKIKNENLEDIFQSKISSFIERIIELEDGQETESIEHEEQIVDLLKASGIYHKCGYDRNNFQNNHDEWVYLLRVQLDDERIQIRTLKTIMMRFADRLTKADNNMLLDAGIILVGSSDLDSN